MSSLPPIRACLFDMDGLLLNTEDLYTLCTNKILSQYGREPLPWYIKAKMMGRPGPAASAIFHDWAQLPISAEEFGSQLSELHNQYFPLAEPLPGVVNLLSNLGRTQLWEKPINGEKGEGEGAPSQDDTKKGPSPHRVHVALATSSTTSNFELKTRNLQAMFSVFAPYRRVLGDDERVAPGRGKPSPDIYLLALRLINGGLSKGERPINPIECLVFEDSIPGVEAARRAGMRVVWCPHPELKATFEGAEGEILAGRMGEAGCEEAGPTGNYGDGMAEYLPSLEEFDYHKYGITLPA